MNSVESNGGTRPPEPGLRKRRYAIRYPFAANAEVFDLKTGARLRGVTSDLSPGGCFVCTGGLLESGARVRLTLTRKDKTLTALAAVRVLKSRTGIGLEFLDVDPNSHKTLLVWLESLRQRP